MTIHTIYQGEDCSILIEGVVDDGGEALDVTGWSVVAHARPDATSSTLWQEWSSTEGTAIAAGVTITLAVPHEMSAAWIWGGQTGVLQVEITEPGGLQRRARVAGGRIYLDPEAVRP